MGQRSTIEDASVYRANNHANKGSNGVFTMGATVTLTEAAPDILAYDPGGAARNLDLYAISATNVGRVHFISNEADAAETLTVRNSAAGTVVAIAQNKSAIVWSTLLPAGTYAWRHVLLA